MKAEIILDGGEEYPIPLYADRIRSIYFQRGRTIYADVVDNLTREYTTGELEEAFPGLLAACKETYPALDWSAYTPWHLHEWVIKVRQGRMDKAIKATR